MLRQARREDIPAMHRVRMSVLENRLTSAAAVTEASYVPALEEWGRGWVVEADDEIVGFAAGNATDGNVWALFVDPRHQGQGHGRRLHDTLVAWLWACGLDQLWLTTDPGTRAQRFYEAAGWQCVGRTESGELRFELHSDASKDIRAHNRLAWNRQVERGSRWTRSVSRQAIDAAKQGVWEILLTPRRPVPRGWLGNITKRRILCLASGGGQQAPILAAAGGLVTVLDNSPKQLEQDARLAHEYHLPIETVLGDMTDLRMFRELSFDIVVHPVSNCFVPHIQPVWNEAYRVLGPGGQLLSGFGTPSSMRSINSWRNVKADSKFDIVCRIRTLIT